MGPPHRFAPCLLVITEVDDQQAGNQNSSAGPRHDHCGERDVAQGPGFRGAGGEYR